MDHSGDTHTESVRVLVSHSDLTRGYPSHIDLVLASCSQSLYAPGMLHSHGLPPPPLQEVLWPRPQVTSFMPPQYGEDLRLQVKDPILRQWQVGCLDKVPPQWCPEQSTWRAWPRIASRGRSPFPVTSAPQPLSRDVIILQSPLSSVYSACQRWTKLHL